MTKEISDELFEDVCSYIRRTKMYSAGTKQEAKELIYRLTGHYEF